VPIFQRKRKKNERDTERERGKKQRKTRRQTKSQWLAYPENALVGKGKSADPKLAGIGVGYPWPGGVGMASVSCGKVRLGSSIFLASSIYSRHSEPRYLRHP
jgi:hypothetical protein